MPRKRNDDKSEVDALVAVSATLAATLTEAEQGHRRNAVLHLERAIAELRADEQEAAEHD